MRRITTGDMMHVHGSFGAKVAYTARLSVRMTDPVDPALLERALEKTRRRYPYLCVRMERDGESFYYEDNPLPVVLLRRDGSAALNAEETNHHVWAVCCSGEYLHLDMYHGVTDGTGMYQVLATLLYYYCALRYGLTEHGGIRTLEDPVRPEELRDPQDGLAPPEGPQGAPPVLTPAFTLETDGGLTPSPPTLWDVELPEEAFMRFTSAHDASPGTLVSLLLARAVDGLYPRRDKEIVSAYVVNARPMLGAEETCHNCLSMVLFDYSDRIRAMPLTRQCTVYRGKTFLQSDGDRVRAAMAMNAAAVRQAVQESPTLAEKERIFGEMFQGGEGLVTFLVSYTGQWRHPALGSYMRELWGHPPNTFSLMAELGAAGGKVFLTLQQRFREDTVREAFLRQLEENGIPYAVRRRMASDIAAFPPPGPR